MVSISNLKSLYLCAALLMVVQGCKKTETAEYTDWPIIESYLSPGGFIKIKISRQISFFSDAKISDDNINNLNVKLIYNNTSYTLKLIGDGLYTDSSIVIKPGDVCSIEFNFNGKKVEAYTYIPTRPSGLSLSSTTMSIEKIDSTFTPGSSSGTRPDPIEITWTNNDADYYLTVIENLDSNPVRIRNFGNNSSVPSLILRKSPNTGSTEELRENDFQYFGKHRVILFHILPDYAALYSSNSTSSQNLSNPSTSIKNGYGIFTGLNSDTAYIEIKQK